MGEHRTISGPERDANRERYLDSKKIRQPETRTFRSIRAAELRKLRKLAAEYERRLLVQGKAARA